MTEARFKEGIDNIDKIIALLRQEIALYTQMKVGLEYKRDMERKQNELRNISNDASCDALAT